MPDWDDDTDPARPYKLESIEIQIPIRGRFNPTKYLKNPETGRLEVDPKTRRFKRVPKDLNSDHHQICKEAFAWSSSVRPTSRAKWREENERYWSEQQRLALRRVLGEQEAQPLLDNGLARFSKTQFWCWNCSNNFTEYLKITQPPNARGEPEAECIVKELVLLPLKGRHDYCEIEGYQECRDPSHGIETYQTLRTAECGISPSEVSATYEPSLKPTPEAKKLCSTADEAHENSAEEISAKINQLTQNLDILQSASTQTETLARAKVEILLEIWRLETRELSIGASRHSLAEITTETRTKILSLLKKGEDPVQEAVRQAFQSDRNRIAGGLLKLFPETAAAMQKQARNQYLELPSAQYAMLFSNGIFLTSQEMEKAPNTLAELYNGNSAEGRLYRFVEIYTRTALANLKQYQKQILELLGIRDRLQADPKDFSDVMQQVARNEHITPTDKNELNRLFRGAVDAREQNELLLKFVNGQIRIQIREQDAKRKELWALIERAKNRSNDPRFFILEGYRALAEIDAPAYTRAVQTARSQIASTNTPYEARLSLRLLAIDARDGLDRLRMVQKVLDETDQQQQVEKTLVERLEIPLENGTVPDSTMVELLISSLDAVDGGYGLDSRLRSELRSQISMVYKDFLAALDRGPSVELYFE